MYSFPDLEPVFDLCPVLTGQAKYGMIIGILLIQTLLKYSHLIWSQPRALVFSLDWGYEKGLSYRMLQSSAEQILYIHDSG